MLVAACPNGTLHIKNKIFQKLLGLVPISDIMIIIIIINIIIIIKLLWSSGNTQVQDVEIKVCTHRFECDVLKVAATQTYWTYRINYI